MMVRKQGKIADWIGIGVGILFLAALGISTLIGQIIVPVLAVYVIASGVAFKLYANDKAAARGDRWRTRETTLLAAGLCGGWPGALIAQRVYRHKSRKTSFQIVFWVTVFMNLVALGWIQTLIR